MALPRLSGGASGSFTSVQRSRGEAQDSGKRDGRREDDQGSRGRAPHGQHDRDHAKRHEYRSGHDEPFSPGIARGPGRRSRRWYGSVRTRSSRERHCEPCDAAHAFSPTMPRVTGANATAAGAGRRHASRASATQRHRPRRDQPNGLPSPRIISGGTRGEHRAKCREQGRQRKPVRLRTRPGTDTDLTSSSWKNRSLPSDRERRT